MPFVTEDHVSKPANGLDFIQPDGKGTSGLSQAKSQALETRDDLLASPKAPCRVHDYVNHHISTRPDSPAIQFESAAPITYSQLDKMASHISKALSIKPNSIVPICMDVSVEFIATILAVLRSGAAYCVLDPGGSVERNNGIVEDTNASMVLVHRIYGKLFGNRGLSIEDALSKEVIEHPETRNEVETTTDDAAYLVYTSGKRAEEYFQPFIYTICRLYWNTKGCSDQPRRRKPRH